MAEQTVGVARVDVVVNTDQFDAAITSAKRSVKDMSQAAQDQYNRLSAAEKRRVDSLINQANKIGLTKEQQLAYNAALRTSGPILDDITRKLRQQEAAAVRAGIANGKSAKELQFAMRQLPAQLTDISVGLATGQRPLMVLLQQGGQLKDLFGGIGPAARALGSSIAGLINPFTLTAAAVGALVLAFEKGRGEAEAFNEALILTGGYAGVTAKDAQRLAEQMDNLAGVTQSKASAALSQVAATGRFTGETFELVTEAALAMNVATGKAIEDTIAEFEKIAKDPVKALLELNSTYHFLTKAQLAHINQLQDEGREAEAAAEATRIYSDTLRERSQEVLRNVGLLESQWRSLKGVAAETWDALLAVGREDTIASRIAQAAVLASQRNYGGAYAQLSGAARTGNVNQLVEAAMRQNDQLLNGVDSERAAKEIEEQRKERQDATRTWLQLQQQNLDKKQKQLAEEKKITEAGRLLGKTEAQINEEIAKSRARFAESEKKRGGTKSSATDPTASILARIQKQIQLNQLAAESEGKVTAAQRLRVQVESELARIGAKATPARRAQIEAALKEAEASEAVAEAHKAEVKAKEELTRLTNQLTAAEANRRAQNQLDLISIGRGGDELMRLQRRLDIEREYEDGLKQLRDKGIAETDASYIAQEQALRESRDRMLAEEDDFFTRRTELMGDWRNGAIAAMEDFMARTADVAGQTRDLIGGAFDQLSDSLADFITGASSAKDAFGAFADYLFQQSAKMVADQFLRQILGGFGGQGSTGDTAFGTNSYSSGGGGGWVSSLIGALFGGGRALGGDVQPGRVYEVGEMNRPEMFMAGGKQFLIPGNRGEVEPIRGGGSTLNQTVIMQVQGKMTNQTADQAARELGRETQYRMARA